MDTGFLGLCFKVKLLFDMVIIPANVLHRPENPEITILIIINIL